MKRVRLIEEAAAQCGMQQEVLLRFISYAWIQPAEDNPPRLDEEDLARALLIRELQEDFGVNDAGVPIILHLLDQLHRLRQELRRAG